MVNFTVPATFDRDCFGRKSCDPVYRKRSHNCYPHSTIDLNLQRDSKSPFTAMGKKWNKKTPFLKFRRAFICSIIFTGYSVI